MEPYQVERFHQKYVVDENGCWVWIKAKNTNGYGVMALQFDGLVKLAHRIAYEHWVGPIPKGYHLHHTCFQRACVNPDHLQLVHHSQHKELHRRGRTP